MKRLELLKAAPLGLIAACSGGLGESSPTGLSLSRRGPLTYCKPGSGSFSYTNAPPDRHGIIAWYGLTVYDCKKNIVGQLTIYTGDDAYGDLWLTGYGDTTVPSIQDKRWTKKELIKLYDKMVVTPVVNGAIVGSNASEPISEETYNPEYYTYMAYMWVDSPSQEQQYQGYYGPSGSARRLHVPHREAVSPASCASARFNFAAACGASLMAALLAPESFGLTLGALAVAGAAVAGTALDMQEQCRH